MRVKLNDELMRFVHLENSFIQNYFIYLKKYTAFSALGHYC